MQWAKLSRLNSVTLVCKNIRAELIVNYLRDKANGGNSYDQVKSTVPFSEPYVIDPSNPPSEKDYEVYFKELKEGITGKEALEAIPAQV